MDFIGKKILITGSTMGIGRAAAEMFLAAGAHVAINSRKPAGVDQAIRDMGRERLVAAPGDVATVAGCRSVVDTAVRGLGGLDILVNNAGICPLAYVMDVTEAHWDEVMAVNLRAPLFCTKFALPALRESKGNVVMVASVGGLCAGPTDSLVYAISKGALVNMTRTLALELVGEGIRVNAVCPGYIDTPMVQAENTATNGQIYDFVNRSVPMGRIGTLREGASAIVYAASADASYVTGSILVNDGGCLANTSWGGANIGAPAGAPPPQFTPNSLTG
jgi:NAD(P)-dependent dehydrogenase (short-subunit alcohol dehydrogenase family)